MAGPLRLSTIGIHDYYQCMPTEDVLEMVHMMTISVTSCLGDTHMRDDPHEALPRLPVLPCHASLGM